MTLSLDAQLPILLSHMWPMFRVGAMFMVMPAIGNAFVPPQARMLLVVSLTVVLAPLSAPPNLEFLSVAGGLAVAREIAIGLMMGFTLKLIMDAVALGGQSVAMSMGLGFAIFIDSARGVNVPVIGQFLLLLSTLLFLSLDGHLQAIALLADSFRTLPTGAEGGLAIGLGELLRFSSVLISGAVKIAIPAITALLVVNIGFGVMSRAAPTLNLFAVGFPVSLLFGLIALMLSMDGITQTVTALFAQAFSAMTLIVAGGPTP